ncbi:MAG: hypothetical protein A2Y73_02955 [Chloroflexi bacterium RBG_13_56_8]|nr:MAG: hypothetical protein A2Y73_02955 [Chloroflexi bacterium RBG_13_56_8]
MEIRRNRTTAVLMSAAITIAVVGSMIIIHERDTGFKAFLNMITGHHWVTKSVFTVILFPLFSIIFYFIIRSEKAQKALKANDLWFWSLVLMAITLFFTFGSFLVYLIEYLVA